MGKSQPHEGPGKGIITTGQRILTTLIRIVETRLRLAVVELADEKAKLVQLLLMAGLTMLFTAFGLMSLMILIIWAIDPQYRFMAITITTGTLLFLAVVFSLLCLRKSRTFTLLQHTREELKMDRKRLKDNT